MKLSLAAFCIGFVLDLLLGDPKNIPHPVCLIGAMITKIEGVLRRRVGSSPAELRRAGLYMAVLVPVISALVPLCILVLLGAVSPLLRLLAEAVFCWQILAVTSLKRESMKVYTQLINKDLPAARTAVSMIVGRDTAQLSDIGVAKAAVETVAENTSDGVVAPILFMTLGGAPLGFFYKAVNTMDSMLGYKNEEYLHFGRCAALLDDAVNYIPARISAYIMLAATAVLRMDLKGAVKIYKRDKQCHASPNSAQTESVCAGALGVQLAGDAYYFGELHTKLTIGDDTRPVCYEDISAANHLMYTTAVLSFAVCALLKLAVILFLN